VTTHPAAAFQAFDWFSKHPADAIKSGLVILTAILAALGVFWRKVAEISKIVYEQQIGRLHVCVISKLNARRLDDFIDLYHQIFDESERASTSEIHAWLQGKGLKEGIEYRLYLALLKSRPAGIAIGMYDRATKAIYIPYFGVSPDVDSTWGTTHRVVQAMVRSMTKSAKGWEVGVVEVADPGEPDITEVERRRRRARVRRLGSLVTGAALHMVQPQLQYVQPIYDTDGEAAENKTMLLFLLHRSPPRGNLPKGLVLDILGFVYLKVYLLCFSGSSNERQQYSASLKSRLSYLKAQLPRKVPFENAC
jgi:hypothetical protein